jgi:hypothetical protein
MSTCPQFRAALTPPVPGPWKDVREGRKKPRLPLVTVCRYMEIHSHGRAPGKRLNTHLDVDNRLVEPENTIREPESPPIKKIKTRS